MASNDAKLKFLPRHLQRSQPASSSKSKRRVTVEDDNAADEESDRRSVFDRLGPGGPHRNERPKFDQGQSGKGRSKNSGDKSPDSLKLKLKGSKDRETKMRSQVVVKKSGAGGVSDDDSGGGVSDSWSIDNLEDKKERELEMKRQEIQRALKALDDGDDAPVIETKKSESSGSDSSPERNYPKKKEKEKTSKKKEKKKHKKVSVEKEMSLERQPKRKHGSDTEEGSPHKKKRKKNKKHTEEDSPAGASAPPPALMSIDVRKPVKESQQQMYEPESPTSSPQREQSPEVVTKGKKKKKKKAKVAVETHQGKSKKLVTSLTKVLKLKKGPASVTSSKRSRSESRDSLKKKGSRSSSSSSSGSSSDTPVRRKKGGQESASTRRDGQRRVKSKSLERKKKPSQTQREATPQRHRQQQHQQRSASSSSSSSSSSNSSPARRSRGRPQSKHGETRSKITVSSKDGHHQQQYQPQQRQKRSRSPVARGMSLDRKEAQAAKRKRDMTTGSLNRSKDRKGGGRESSPQPYRQGAGVIRGDERGRQRDKQQNEGKGHRGMPQPVPDRDRGGPRQTSKERGKRPMDTRDREKGDREESGRQDDSRDRSSGRAKDRDRSEDMGRRPGGEAGGPQQNERGGRMIRRGGDMPDRDRRNFGVGPGRDNSGSRFDRGRMGRGDNRGDWDTGRDARPYPGPREDANRDFGGGPGKRREGNRDERPFPHLERGEEGGMYRHREEFGGSRDRRAASPDAGDSKRDRDGGRGGDRDDSRGGRGRPDDRPVRDNTPTTGRGRDGRDRMKGAPGANNRGLSSGGSSRIVTKLRSEPTKENSPSVGRDESSLAAVFDQTETTRSSNNSTTPAAAIKKRPTKSFGGKKSPKKAADTTKAGGERPRLGVGTSALAARGRRQVGARKGMPASSHPVKRTEKPKSSRDTSKGDTKTAAKKERDSKEKTSPGSQSPRGSQKSAESRRSQSHSRSSRRSSRSPPAADTASSTRRDVEASKSPSRRSRSPAKASAAGEPHAPHQRHQDSAAGGEDQSRNRKKDDSKKGDFEKGKILEKGKQRGRSHSLSDSEMKHSPPAEERSRRKSTESIESLPAKLDGGDIAAAMLGDGLEDGQQEHVFSDWSDDDDTFNNIIDVDSRKSHVEDLDNHHRAEMGYRGGRGPHDFRGRRDSPGMGPPPSGLMMHGGGGFGPGQGPHYHDDFDSPGGFGHRGGGDLHHHHPHSHHGALGMGRYQDSDMLAGDSGALDEQQDHLGISGGRVEDPGQAQMDSLLAKPALEKNIPDVKIVEDVQKEKPARERRKRNTGEEGYEEISSDENDLDEEGERVPKRTIVSILDIDMSSLVQATAKPAGGLCGKQAVFQRFKACNVFSQLGLSRRFAGEELFKRVTEECQKQIEEGEEGEEGTETKEEEVKEEKKAATSDSTSKSEADTCETTSSQNGDSADTAAKPKVDIPDQSELSVSNQEIKQEADTAANSEEKLPTSNTTEDACIDPTTEKQDGPPQTDNKSSTSKNQRLLGKRSRFMLYGNTPADHILHKTRTEDRSRLLGNFGLFRRALTARKDLDIRRQLCRIDSKYDQSAIYPTGLVDPDMFRLSVQLLKQKKASMLTASVG